MDHLSFSFAERDFAWRGVRLNIEFRAGKSQARGRKLQTRCGCLWGGRRIGSTAIVVSEICKTGRIVQLKLIKGGIDWLARENKLVLGDQVFCLVQDIFDQWVLEYNPVTVTKQELAQPASASSFVVRSSKLRISKAPEAVWHERLAHCGPEVLEHLPTAVTGVKLVDGPTTSECEVCGLSKSHSHVDLHHRQRNPLTGSIGI